MPIPVEDSVVPSLVYGTAWKEEETERLTLQALEAGFLGIDTANQRKHYHEAGVGAALARAFAQGLVKRENLFLQTKFTSVRGQDHRLPYDPKADPGTQVRQSFARSLEHLGVDRLDSLVLHGPAAQVGLTPYDHEVWAAIEALQQEGKTRFIGISNVRLEQLALLCERARVRPRFVQNRCYAREGWDRQVRAFCRSHGIVYQGFSLLTANARELASTVITSVAARLGKTPAQVVFTFALQIGMQPLTGTRSVEHLAQDLACERLALSAEDLRAIEDVSTL